MSTDSQPIQVVTGPGVEQLRLSRPMRELLHQVATYGACTPRVAPWKFLWQSLWKGQTRLTRFDSDPDRTWNFVEALHFNADDVRCSRLQTTEHEVFKFIGASPGSAGVIRWWCYKLTLPIFFWTLLVQYARSVDYLACTWLPWQRDTVLLNVGNGRLSRCVWVCSTYESPQQWLSKISQTVIL